MEYNEIIAIVSDKLGLSKDMVDKVYKSYWRSVKEYISSLPLKEDLSDEEFLSLQPNVNIPSIGKLYVTLDRYKRLKQKMKILESLTEKENKDAAH
jgi:hypothetical protein